MKINLEIGDWVLCYNNIEPRKVLTISDEGVNACGFFEQVPIGELKPIHITTEILEKNGFKLREETHIKDFENWVSEDGRIEINNLSNMKDRDWSVHIDNELYESIGCVDVEYVHELQHVLRLCNIKKEIEL